MTDLAEVVNEEEGCQNIRLPPVLRKCARNYLSLVKVCGEGSRIVL